MGLRFGSIQSGALAQTWLGAGAVALAVAVAFVAFIVAAVAQRSNARKQIALAA